MFPTLKTLAKAFPYADTGRLALLCSIADGTTSTESLPETLPQTMKWIASCYHRPSDAEIIMAVADEILGGYGVEAIQDSNGDFVLDYVNMGDTYDTTLLRDLNTGRVFVSSWGDEVEKRRL